MGLKIIEIAPNMDPIAIATKDLVRLNEPFREFVNNYLLAKDARALRLYYKQVNPDLDMSVVLTNSEGEEEVVDLPIGLNFFWPDF